MITEVLSGGKDVIDRLAAEWTAVCDEGASHEPFLRPEWFCAFVNCFEKNILIVTVRQEGRLRALLPLVLKAGALHGLPVRKLRAIYNLNSQRFDLIHGADENERRAIVEAIWSGIGSIPGWNVFEARLVKKSSWLNDVLTLAGRDRHRVGVWPMDAAPYISLPGRGDADDFLATYFRGARKHLRQELDRRLRRLQELGTVEVVRSNEYSPELGDIYFDLEARGWKGRNGTAVKDSPVVIDLHEHFAKAVGAAGALSIYQLKLDGKTLAMSMNIRSGSQTIHWKTSYDEAFSKYSPGNLLFRELLRNCIATGSTEIDFLSPSSPNKLSWATGEREHAAYYIFNRGLWGSFAWRWKFKLAAWGRELRRTVPSGRPALDGSR